MLQKQPVSMPPFSKGTCFLNTVLIQNIAVRTPEKRHTTITTHRRKLKIMPAVLALQERFNFTSHAESPPLFYIHFFILRAEPDHRRRGKRRRGSGYAAGYEHRPSRFSLNGPQQFSQRYAQPFGNYGFNGSQTAAGGGPKPDRFGFGYSGSSGTAGRRKQEGTFHCGGKRYIYGRNRNRGAVQI